MTVSASITKIRRLVGDVNSQEFTDAQIIPIFARMQQEFCRETLCEVKAVSLLAPPRINSCHCFSWEEGFLSGTSFAPWFRDSASSSSQAWELEASYTQTSSGGYTHTDGVGLSSQEAQHPIPFFWPDDFYKPLALTWNYKWVSQKSIDWVHEYRRDAFTNTGVVVDWFAALRDTRKKGFLTHSVPYTVGEATNEATAVGAALVADVFYSIYESVPTREPSVTLDYTDFSETDDPSKVTVAARTITLVAGDRDEDYYVTQDLGSGYFADFTHWVDVSISSSVANSESRVYAWALSNTDDDLKDIDDASGDAIFLSVGYLSSNFSVKLFSLDGGTLTELDASAGRFGIHYLAINRTGTTLTVEVYSTAALRIAGGGGDVDTISGTCVDTAFRYVYGLGSYNVGTTTQDISCKISNLIIYPPTGIGAMIGVSSVALYKPFRKFLEYGCAAKLLAMDTPKRDKKRAIHYRARYEIGKQLTKGIMRKAMVNRKLVLGGPTRYGGGRPPRPRFPDHYPEVRF